ncbi:hypothetical protein SFRURICE_004258 [Spodoptera frugiperda]|nr:hypothetical protein SFRURICE_004258 [Spodoptera frugiperda]
MRDVAASAHAAYDEESLCHSKLVERFSIKNTILISHSNTYFTMNSNKIVTLFLCLRVTRPDDRSGGFEVRSHLQ